MKKSQMVVLFMYCSLLLWNQELKRWFLSLFACIWLQVLLERSKISLENLHGSMPNIKQVTLTYDNCFARSEVQFSPLSHTLFLQIWSPGHSGDSASELHESATKQKKILCTTGSENVQTNCLCPPFHETCCHLGSNSNNDSDTDFGPWLKKEALGWAAEPKY